jgi:hypothetical protein
MLHSCHISKGLNFKIEGKEEIILVDIDLEKLKYIDLLINKQLKGRVKYT